MKLDHVARQAWLRQQGRNSDVVTSLEKLEVNTAPPASASWAAEGLFGRASGAGVGGRRPSPPHAEAAVHFFPGQNYSSLGSISVLVTQLKVSVAGGSG